MKILNSIVAILFSLTFFACNKQYHKPATVVRDCTGTYLKLDGKDYQVCNLEKVAHFPDGMKVTASFTKINTCKGSAKDAVVCFMLHASEGWIEVDNIK